MNPQTSRFDLSYNICHLWQSICLSREQRKTREFNRKLLRPATDNDISSSKVHNLSAYLHTRLFLGKQSSHGIQNIRQQSFPDWEISIIYPRMKLALLGSTIQFTIIQIEAFSVLGIRLFWTKRNSCWPLYLVWGNKQPYNSPPASLVLEM